MECKFMSSISHTASVKLAKSTSEAPAVYMETEQYGLSSVDDIEQTDASSVSPTLSGLPSSSATARDTDFPFSSTVISGSDDLSVTVSLSISGEDADLVASTSDSVLVPGSGSDQLTIRGMVSDVQAALRAVTISAAREIASAETVAYSASVSSDQTSSVYSGTITILPSVLFSLPTESRTISDILAAVSHEETAQQQSTAVVSDSTQATVNDGQGDDGVASATAAVSQTDIASAAGSARLLQSGNENAGDSNLNSMQTTNEGSATLSPDQTSGVSIPVSASPEKMLVTSDSNGSVVLGAGAGSSAMQNPVSAQALTPSASVDAVALETGVLSQASYGVAWTSPTDAGTTQSGASTDNRTVTAPLATTSETQQDAMPLLASTDQTAAAVDTGSTGLLNDVDTIGTVNQADESSVSVTSTVSGTNNIEVNNGIVALDGGTNTVVAQDQGTAAVWSAAGTTSFNDAGSGDAEFHVTGTGTFDVQDTGTGDATLRVMQLASSDASGTITGGARHLDVTTGSGSVNVVAGLGGLDLSTAGSGALQIDITQGTDHILIAGDQTGNVTVSGAVVNANANFGIMGVTSEKIINGHFVVGLTDGNSVTFLGASGGDNITLYLA